MKGNTKVMKALKVTLICAAAVVAMLVYCSIPLGCAVVIEHSPGEDDRDWAFAVTLSTLLLMVLLPTTVLCLADALTPTGSTKTTDKKPPSC